MANNLNKVIMQGNLTKDPEFKDVDGKRTCKLSIEAIRQYKDKKEACLVDAYCWDEFSEIAERDLTKGSSILLEGRLKQVTWLSENGENRHRHVIEITYFTILPDDKDNHEI